MKKKNILIALMVFAVVVTSCMTEDFGDPISNGLTTNTSSVITLTPDRFDGIVNLSVDAPQNSSADLWIDLNGDGIRAEDGTENISVFNQHQDYRLEPGLKTVSIYGDITYLACASNELTTLDVSENPFLTTLNAPLNLLTELDVSKNSALKSLDCSGNSITTLNVLENSALVSLWTFNNQLSVLNLSNNADLSFLDCSGNQITSLDVSKNSELVRLVCFNNLISNLDISHNNKLNRLWIFGNQFSNKETERISDMMKDVSNVDLWMSDFDNVSP